MIEIEKHYETYPVCPHCKNEVRKLFYHEIRGFFGRRYVYFCPACKAVLGVSHRKGFWMG